MNNSIIYFTRYGSEVNVSIEKSYKGNRFFCKNIGSRKYRMTMNCKGNSNLSTIDVYLNKEDLKTITKSLGLALFDKSYTNCTIENEINKDEHKYFKLFNYPFILINLFSKIKLIFKINCIPNNNEDEITLKSSVYYKIGIFTIKPKRIQPYNLTISKNDIKRCIRELNATIQNNF